MEELHPGKKRHVICMVSDFFYPKTGGVEAHIYNLSLCLVKLGHKVIIMTHAYGQRTGIRYLTCGLKIYYLPIKVFYAQSILPTMICNIPLTRYILIRESVEIVHAHSAFSVLGHEVSIIAKLMGLKTVFTDHSLFGFADTSAVLTNSYLQLCLYECDHCICVSKTGQENTTLRAKVPSDKVTVIPNAVDAYSFRPDPSKIDHQFITVIIMSRLVYRKGVDLMAKIIPEMCSEYPKLRFIIGGDGNKKWLLDEVGAKLENKKQMDLLGNLKHSQVRNELVKGNIFLNTSLTEAFCMAIVEAASCGLRVVSTNVGGIPEVLPESLRPILKEPKVGELIDGLKEAIKDIENRKIMCPFECNEIIRNRYNWMNVSRQTEDIYNKISMNENRPFGLQLCNYLEWGKVPFLLVLSLIYLLLKIFEKVYKREHIDKARDLVLEESS